MLQVSYLPPYEMQSKLQTMLASVDRCTNVSIAQSNEESSSVDVRFAANGLLKVDSTLQTSRSNYKQDIGTFMPSRHNQTWKERSKVKCDTTKRFVAYGFLKVDCTVQTSRTNNEQD